MSIEATGYLSMSDLADEVQDVEDAIDGLVSEIDALEEEISDLYGEDEQDDEAIGDLELERDNKQDELEELREESRELFDFYKEMDGYVDSGETLIREDEFEDYAREMAYDTGAVDRNADWPQNRIDWEAAADDLKADYVEGEFEGWTYFGRCS